jgi:hypothetical protein
MKRSTFLFITGIIPIIFGTIMMIAPGSMLANMLTNEANLQTLSVTQWVGCGIFSIGLVNFLSRKDPGSIALKALMFGNIALHSLGLCFDFYDFTNSVMTFSGLITGLILHLVFIIGFGYYLIKAGK